MIVGVIGKKQSGKSAIGKHLVSKGYEVLPMAYTLKRMLQEMGVPHQHLYGSEEEKETPLEMLGGKTARRAMQTLGTEWGRDIIDFDLWAKMWTKKVKQMMAEGQNNIVCDDVRMYNECDAVENIGGILIYVQRPGVDSGDGHFSEIHIENLPYHYIVVNSGTLDDLREKVDDIIRCASGRKGASNEKTEVERDKAEISEDTSE
jgi:hypothetical protein